MKKIDGNNIVVKSNELVEARYRLTATEQKILYKLISVINKDDEDFKPYTFKINDLIDLLDTNNKNTYADIKETTKNLMKKVFSIQDKINRHELQIAWFSSALYKDGEGIVELEFSPKLKPFLLQLKQTFTQFDIKNVMQLRSGYSCRIYELLKQYEKIKERTLEIEDIRGKLGIQDDEYKLYADFKRYVILQAQKEINTKTDISFEFKEIKESRKVIAMKFIISSRPSNSDFTKSFKKLSGQVELNEINDINQFINTFKKKYNGSLDHKILQNMINSHGMAHIQKCFNNFNDYISGSVSGIEGLFVRHIQGKLTKPTQYKKTLQHQNLELLNQYENEDYEKFYNKFKVRNPSLS